MRKPLISRAILTATCARSLVVALLLALAVPLGCDQQDHSTQRNSSSTNLDRATRPLNFDSDSALTVKAEVYQGFYGSLGGTASPVEYRVVLTATNSSSTSIQFDEVVAAFVPHQGTPLVTSTRNAQGIETGTKQFDSDHQTKIGSRNPWILQPGESHQQEFATNGYTFEVLRDAGSKPLQFHLHFLSNGKPVTNRFVASLPNIQDLPIYERLFTDKNAEKGKQLEFHQSNN